MEPAVDTRETPPLMTLKGRRTRRTPREVLSQELSRFEHGVSLVCWGYNEAGLMEEFLERAHRLMSESVVDFEIVVVNDGSTDGTREILERASQQSAHLRVINFPENRGIGEAAKVAIASASKQFLFWQTIDWSYDLTDLRYFLELLKEHDVVAGVRRGPLASGGSPMALAIRALKHLQTRSDNVNKALVSICNYLLVRVLFNFPMSDYQNVSLYPTDLIQSINLEARSSFGNPELLMKSYWRGASIIEVPIRFLPRQVGEAKGTRLGSILKSVGDIFKLWWKWIVVQRLPFQGPRGQIRRLVPGEWVQRVTPSQESKALTAQEAV